MKIKDMIEDFLVSFVKAFFQYGFVAAALAMGILAFFKILIHYFGGGCCE